MTVRQLLDLSEEGPRLDEVRQAWQSWRGDDPRLRQVQRLDDLRWWLPQSDFQTGNNLLLALAERAAIDGGNDHQAAAALAWVLIPGAARLAERMSDLDDDIDSLVSGQLWLEVRCFPWRRRLAVSSHILFAVRRAMLRECGRPQPRGRDRVWAATTVSRTVGELLPAPRSDVHKRPRTRTAQAPLPPPALVGAGCLGATGPAWRPVTEELRELLGWAVDNHVMTESERHVLECLVEAAVDVPALRRGGACGGLTSTVVLAGAARRLGVTERQVYRHATRVIAALVAAAPRYLDEQGPFVEADELGDGGEVSVAVETWLWHGRATTAA